MNTVKYDDLLQFTFLSRPAFSPDGSKIAYVASKPDLTINGYHSCLWLFDLTAGSGRQLTYTGSEKFFCWSADGQELIFASSREDNEKNTTCFYSLPLTGGEARKLFAVPAAANGIADLGSGKYLISANYEPAYDNPENADYYVIEQVPFTANGKGFVCQRRTSLGIYDASESSFAWITSPHMEVMRWHLNEKRDSILFIGVEYTDVKPTKNHVYEYTLRSGQTACLSEGCSFAFKDANWCENGVLVTGSDQKHGGVNQNIKFFLLNNKTLVPLTPELDSSLRNSIGSDCRYNTADQEGCFTVNGDRIIYCSTDGYKSHLHARENNGIESTLSVGLSSVDNWAWHSGKGAVTGLRKLNLQELYLVSEDGNEQQLTHHNDFLGLERVLSVPEYTQFENDGWKLDGWYMKPVGFQQGEKYPTILHIHGGPKSAFGDVYFHEMQCWAAQGYAVIYCNPRGGDGRPDGFDDIRGYYGVKDYSDIMAFMKHCLATLPFIDEKHVGVTGGSYGGYMTNWIVTQTDFFKAAAAQRPISNWISKYGSCDIGYYYVEDQHGGRPWENPELAWQESPLKHVANVKTPLLLIQSQEDFRCERDQSFQMFTALKVLGVECRMCLFNGENHELSRSGRPRNRLARMREITSWFDKHLKV